MGDWFIATEGVKIVKDSPGLLPQIITGVSTIICSDLHIISRLTSTLSLWHPVFARLTVTHSAAFKRNLSSVGVP